MKRHLCFLALLAGIVSAQAELAISFKDGRSATAPSVRLQGRTLMAAVAGGKGEVGYPLETVAKVDFPEPPQIKAAAALLAQAKAAEALAQIAPVVAEAAPLKDVPGNWWAPAALVQLDAFLALDRKAEIAPLLDALSRAPLAPGAMLSIRLRQAAALAHQGDQGKALAAYEGVIAQSEDPSVTARAWLGKGRILLAQRKWEAAAFACLRIPVFYPEQKDLLPAALLASARALSGLGDKGAAEEQLRALLETCPASPEAAEARAELQRIQNQQT